MFLYSYEAKASKQIPACSTAPPIVLHSSGLSTGVAVEIGVGCTLEFIAILCAVVFLFFRRRRRLRGDGQTAEQSPQHGNSMVEEPQIEASASPTAAPTSIDRVGERRHLEMSSIRGDGAELPADPISVTRK